MKTLRNIALLTLLTLSACNRSAHYNPLEPYVASTHSKIFHQRTCRHANQIELADLESFPNRERAAARHQPCKTCNP